MKLITYYGWMLLAFTLVGSSATAADQPFKKRPLEEATPEDRASLKVAEVIRATRAANAYPLCCLLCARRAQSHFTHPRSFRAHLAKKHKEDLKIDGIRPEHFYEPYAAMRAPVEEPGETSLLDMLAICATAELVEEGGSASAKPSPATSVFKKTKTVAAAARRVGRPPKCSPPVKVKPHAPGFFRAAASSVPTPLVPPGGEASEWDLALMVAEERIKARHLPMMPNFIDKERNKYLSDPDQVRIFLDYVQYVLYELEIEAVTPAQEAKVKDWKKGVQQRYRNQGLCSFLERIIAHLQKGGLKARKFNSHCLELKRLLEECLRSSAAATAALEEALGEASLEAEAPPARGDKEGEESEKGEGDPLQLPQPRSVFISSSAVSAGKSLSALSAAIPADQDAQRSARFDAAVNAALLRIDQSSIFAPELLSLSLQQRINALLIKATEEDLEGNILGNAYLAEAVAEMGEEISMEGDWGYLYVIGGLISSLLDKKTTGKRRIQTLGLLEEYSNKCSSREIVDIFMGEVIAALLHPLAVVDSFDKKLATQLTHLGRCARHREAKQKRLAWLAAEDFAAASTVSASAAASAAHDVVDLTGEEESECVSEWDPFRGLV